MAQADTLVAMVKAANAGDQRSFRHYVDSLIQEERRKGHRILADRLEKAVLSSCHKADSFLQKDFMTRYTQGRGIEKNLFNEITPERTFDSLILNKDIYLQLKEFVEEQHRSELLHSYGLSPRHRVLLVGPPGNGKTSIAEALAYELMVPLIVVRYESLIGSYLGETSARLKEVLEYAKTQRCVLFFDEFETLGKERGDTHETGEIKRVVSSLLLQLDDLPDYAVVVAASNHPELLDKAVWRRFQVRLELPLPTESQLVSFIDSMEKTSKVNFGVSSSDIAKVLLGKSFSEAEEFCLTVIRRAVLNCKTNNAIDITREKLEQWKNRLLGNHK